MEQAEEIADRFAVRVASFFSGSWSRKLLGVAVRVREATQDFWAEVQDFRHGKRR
jgi:hypothetical protein